MEFENEEEDEGSAGLSHSGLEDGAVNVETMPCCDGASDGKNQSKFVATFKIMCSNIPLSLVQ